MPPCSQCGLALPAGHTAICPHHLDGDVEFHISNRVFCDFIHRKKEPPKTAPLMLYEPPFEYIPPTPVPVRRDRWIVPRGRGWRMPSIQELLDAHEYQCAECHALDAPCAESRALTARLNAERPRLGS